MPHKYIRITEAYAAIHMDMELSAEKKDDLCRRMERRGITADEVVKDEYARGKENDQ